MINPLQQITNKVLNKPQLTIELIKQKPLQLHNILQVDTKLIDFGECLAGSIHEKKLLITLKESLVEAKVIKLKIVCEDEQLNSLPEYIFGIRFPNQFQYLDQLKFKALKKGSYQLQIGVKTPFYQQYPVKSKLIIIMEDTIGNQFQILLNQTAIIPRIICPKQLYFDGQRIIKFSQIRGKSKKQIKMLFKLQSNIALTIGNQIIGLQKQLYPMIDVKPKQLSISSKGQFVLTFRFSQPGSLEKDFQQMKQLSKTQKYAISYVIRRLLVIKVNQTKFHFHFPIELTYYPQNQKNKSQSNVD